jgi:hypothetical protein
MGKKGRFQKGHKLNENGQARWSGKRSSGDAGAHIRTPRSPRARRFRRHRSL